MICANCGNDHWENVDWARFKENKEDGSPQGMSICLDCGFVTYPDKWQSKEKILEHYRTSYRNPPSVGNLYTCQRKNYFHLEFLREMLEEWKAKGIKKPKILEVGAAFGMTLNMFKTLFPEAEITGTEITPSYKLNAWHEFQIDLQDDFDDSKKYDLIISYKVLEHQLDPHIELARYANCLTENGRLYLSVPTWFNSMVNFGLDGFDLEYYYDPNHINVWSREIIENIVSRSGFEIKKQDHIMYGDTYLLAVNNELKSLPVFKHNIEDIKLRLKKIKRAHELLLEQKYDEAIQIWPDFPTAHISSCEMHRKKIADMGWDYFFNTYLKKAMDQCPNSPEILIMATDYCMRVRKFDLAINYANEALRAKPNNVTSIVQMLNVFKEMALEAEKKKMVKEKITYFMQARNVASQLMKISPQHKDEAISHIYALNALIPKDMQDNV